MCHEFFFFFKQKTAYEMRISDWSSDVCSSDLPPLLEIARHRPLLRFRFETRMAAKMRTDKPVSSIRGRTASSAFRAAGYIPRYRRERAGIYDPSSPSDRKRTRLHSSP